MWSKWERLAKLAALLLPGAALLASAFVPTLSAAASEVAVWSGLVLGLGALAWFLVVVAKTRAPDHEGPPLQDLRPDDQKLIKRAWRPKSRVPASLNEYLRPYARVQERALHRSGWTIAAIALFNMSTALGEGTLRWLGTAILIYLVVLGLALDLVLARWRRVLSNLPHEQPAATPAKLD